MLDYLNALYGIHPISELEGLSVIVVGWVLFGAHYFPNRVAPWAWLFVWQIYAIVTSAYVATVAIHRGDPPVVVYHLVWVIGCLIAAGWLWRKMSTILAPRVLAMRQRRDLARTFAAYPATGWRDRDGHEVIPGECWPTDEPGHTS